MRKLNIIFIAMFLLVFGTALQAQQGASATGGSSSGSGGAVSYTVGQVVYKSSTSNTGTVTQGVQQPFEIFSFGIEEAGGISLHCSTYPNPATDFVVLKVEEYNSEKLTYQLHDMNGKLLENNKVETIETSISMENLTPAIYFLKVFDKQKLIKTFKIIKN